MFDNITAVILAGGKSSRIGTNKAFLKIGTTTLLEETLTKFKNIFKEIIVVANEIEKFDVLDVKIVPDIIVSKGPLGGIYTGLVKSNNFINFIVACDMPFIDENFAYYMINKSKGYDVAVAKYNGRLQPLCAIYSKNCIKPIEKQLIKDNLKIRDFFKDVKVREISWEEIKRLDIQERYFTNINTAEDYKSLVR